MPNKLPDPNRAPHQASKPETEQARMASALRSDLDWREQARVLGVDPNNPEEIIQAARRARVIRAQISRKDPSQFCSFVLRDEQTQKPIKQAPMHEEWHTLLSDNDRQIIWSHVEGGKTNQIAIGRALYELGLNPMLRIAIISNTNDLAKKIARQLGQYIQKSRELHEVFPHLVPASDPSLPWKSQALTIERPGMGAKDASIQAAGMHGNIIGSRIDLLILDDVLDPENTNTPGPREDAYKWLKFICGRLSENGRIWAVTNAWHPDDAMHRLEKDGFRASRFPVVRADGSLTWPAVWPKTRIDKARGPGGLGPLEFARQLMCQARDDTSARFKAEWIEQCVERGKGVPFLQDISELEHEDHHLTEEERAEMQLLRDGQDTVWRLTGKFAGSGIITGVDLAVQKHSAADDTVLFTILVYPNGDRRVLNIRSGKWNGPEIIREIKQCYADFGGMFIVENNAAQAYISQFIIQDTAIPIVPFTTGRNKADPSFGIEGVATELANGKWIIPSTIDPKTKQPVMHKEIQDWITELLYFDPREHTGDRVMASWFAREGARRFVDANQQDGSVNAHVFRPRKK